jgi:chaperonin GroEL
MNSCRGTCKFRQKWPDPTLTQYVDLYAQGVIDPAKVVRTALHEAASVAGLLVTTEAMIAERPKKEAIPALPAGAGMDF